MYDRKTWIILIICSGLLALNLYYNGKNREEIAKQAPPETSSTQNETDFLNQATQTSTAELTVETPPPPTEESLEILKSDKVSFTLSNIGGGIKYAEFIDEFEVGSKTERVRMNRFGGGPIGGLAVNQSPINAVYTYKSGQSIPNKKAVYIAELPSGLIAKKTFTIIEGDKPGAGYLLNFEITVENAGDTSINLNEWSLFLGEASPLYKKERPDQTAFFWLEDGGLELRTSNGKGEVKDGFFSSAKPFMNSDGEEAVQYAGVSNQFFATVIEPLDPAITSVWGKAKEVKLHNDQEQVTSVVSGIQLPSVTLQPATNETYKYHIFVGPKKNNMLRKMDKHWDNSWGELMQYGMFSFVSRPLNWMLNVYHDLIKGFANAWSWGLAIILLTITVRIFIWPLHAKSTRTMKRMAKLKPEMQKLKEKYADDPNKLNTETMGLYRKFGINPLGGCLPMFLQIPIFFGFFKMLLSAVELRGQGFLWVDDLSQPDTLHMLSLPFSIPLLGDSVPLNLLPVVMAGTSFLQMKMTPSTGDKMQQRIMMLMPLMFFFFCYNFAAALALYWTTQNIFSIGQTWFMNKVPEPELKAGKNAGKKSWVQRMAEKQAAMQKAQKTGGKPGNMRDVTPKKKRPPRTGG